MGGGGVDDEGQGVGVVGLGLAGRLLADGDEIGSIGQGLGAVDDDFDIAAIGEGAADGDAVGVEGEEDIGGDIGEGECERTIGVAVEEGDVVGIGGAGIAEGGEVGGFEDAAVDDDGKNGGVGGNVAGGVDGGDGVVVGAIGLEGVGERGVGFVIPA